MSRHEAVASSSKCVSKVRIPTSVGERLRCEESPYDMELVVFRSVSRVMFDVS